MATSQAPIFNSFPPSNHPQPHPQNAPPHNFIAMPRPDLTLNLKHINNTIINPCPRFRFLGSFRVVKSMAATAKNPSTEREYDGVEKTEVKLTLPPPPPERPLPGDCCGSGCVRCVWDVYYEELEAYDNLWRKSDDEKSTSNTKTREE